VHNDRLIDALGKQAFAALIASPGARAYYDQQRTRGVGHHAALRKLGTASSASSTASKPAPATTRPPPGNTTNSTTSRPLLDNKAHGMSVNLTSAARYGGG
jgi:hypothetical protein